MIEGNAFAYARDELPHGTGGKLKVINLWAGPGAGKSTTAAALFNLMKRERFRVEIIPEYAKTLTYEHAMGRLENQLLVLAQQEHQLRRLIGQVDYVIVDSPFPMGLTYCRPEDVNRYQHLIDCLWGDYDNYDFFLKRTAREFQQFGRNQTEAEARALDIKIKELWLEFSDGEFKEINADDISAEYRILDYVLEAQGLKTLAQRDVEGVDGEGLHVVMGGWHHE